MKKYAFTLAEGATHVGMCGNILKYAFTLVEGVTHVDMSDNIRRVAFTLAEVLITLAIIGVVAAMTIPTLISDVSRKQHLVAFKKKYAEIVQAIKLSAIDNMDTSKWDYSLDDEEFFAKYLAPYLKTTRCDDCWVSFAPRSFWFEQPAYAAPEFGADSCFLEYSSIEEVPESDFICKSMLQQCIDDSSYVDKYYPGLCGAWLDAQSTTPPEEPDISYSLVNGSTLGLVKKDVFFYLYLDVNGSASPNKYGADKFVLTVINNNVQPYGYGQSDLTAGEYGCSAEGNGMYCGAMIMQNNWDYPDDYPKL